MQTNCNHEMVFTITTSSIFLDDVIMAHQCISVLFFDTCSTQNNFCSAILPLAPWSLDESMKAYSTTLRPLRTHVSVT